MLKKALAKLNVMRLAYVALTRAGKSGAVRIVDTGDDAQEYWNPL